MWFSVQGIKIKRNNKTPINWVMLKTHCAYKKMYSFCSVVLKIEFESIPQVLMKGVFSCKTSKTVSLCLKCTENPWKITCIGNQCSILLNFEESGTVEWLFNWESESFRLESHWCTWRDFGTQLHYEAPCDLLIKLDNELRETSDQVFFVWDFLFCIKVNFTKSDIKTWQ